MNSMLNPAVGPPTELMCGPVDPALSSSFSTYSGSGYSPARYTQRGTISTAPLGTQGIPPGPAVNPQVQGTLITYLGSDGHLYSAILGINSQSFPS